jgi:hypothetical protein
MEQTIKIPQMKIGKGYITAEKTRSEKPVTYGDPFKSDCVGNWEMKVDLNEWDYGEFKFPNPVKGKKI